MRVSQPQTLRLATAATQPANASESFIFARLLSQRMLVGLVSILALALGCGAAIRLSGGGQPAAVASAPAKAGALSQPATLAISRGLGADLAGYRLERSAGGFLARNARQHLTASFGARGATVSPRGGAHSSIALQAIGSGAALHAVGLAQPLARGNRVEYRRGAATEWFANGPAGVEQGFTIGTKPAGATGNGALTLALGLSGTLMARPGAGGGLVLTDAGGKAMLRYGDLSVTDARGRALPAHMTVERGHVLISVDARGARYPLTVDPLLSQVGELYASEGEKEDQFGSAIAASGGTVVVGEPLDTIGGHIRTGAAYVFTEGIGGWATATQATKLVASNPETEEGFGASVAISGTTIVVGAPGRNSGSGADAGGAYVYSEPAGGWSAHPEQTQVAELINSEDVALYSFGVSVAISDETIVVGTPFYRDYVQNLGSPPVDGAAFVFQEPAGGWANEPHNPETQTATLVAHDAEVEEHGHFGESVAIGADGGEQTVAVGAPVEPVGTEPDKYQHGIVFIFSKPAGGWGISGERFPQAQLTASDGSEFANLGQSVSMSDDVIAAGAPRAEVASVKQGATYIFTAPPGGWASEPEQHDVAKLTTPGGIEGDQYGESVALEGSTVVSVGAGRKAYLFAMPSSGWSGEINPNSEFGGKIYTAGIDGGEALLGALTAQPPGGAGGVNQGAVDVVPFAPGAVTGPASAGTETTAAVEGTVNPDQTKISSCSFQYGISDTYGSEVSCASFPATGVTASTVTATLAGLAPGTTYHYRVLSTNEVDTSYGADETFTTPSGKGIEATPEEKSTGGGSSVAGTTTTTVTSTGGGSPVSVASSSKAVEELLLGCSSSQLILNDAYIRGGRVLLSGSAAKSLIDKKVKILFNEKKQVATATVGANGQFATTAPLPPAKIREALSTRYSAEIGKVRSLHLKLTRRLLLEPPRASGTTVTLSGQVTLPLTKPVAPVVVEEQLECGKTVVAKTFTPPANGRFDITLTVPANARAGIFRLTSKVAANAHAVKHGFTTFSLPLPVALGG